MSRIQRKFNRQQPRDPWGLSSAITPLGGGLYSVRFDLPAPSGAAPDPHALHDDCRLCQWIAARQRGAQPLGTRQRGRKQRGAQPHGTRQRSPQPHAAQPHAHPAHANHTHTADGAA